MPPVARSLEGLDLPRLDFSGLPLTDRVPHRIVSLVASATEVIWALGVGERMVGRSTWCDFPVAARSLPDLGAFQSFRLEGILDQKPDLVVVFASEARLADTLEQQFGLQVLRLVTEEASHLREGVRALGQALSVPERAAILASHLEQEEARIRRRFQAMPRRRVLLVLDRDPLIAPGGGTFLDQIMDLVQAENVVRRLDTTTQWPEIQLERVHAWDPEVIIDLGIGAGTPADEARFWDYWSSQPELAAVSNRRVLLVRGGTLVRPGPRIMAAAEALGEWVHTP